jgi:MFS family permease
MIGYLVVSWMNDNLGRKKSIMIGLSIALLGITLITFSFSLLMAQVGLLLAGFGIDPSINTVFYFIA